MLIAAFAMSLRSLAPFLVDLARFAMISPLLGVKVLGVKFCYWSLKKPTRIVFSMAVCGFADPGIINLRDHLRVTESRSTFDAFGTNLNGMEWFVPMVECFF